MNNRFRNLEIHAGDIWLYERNYFKKTSETEYYDKVCEIIREFAVYHIKPFSTTSDNEQNTINKYSANYEERSKTRKIDYYEYDGDYYNYGEAYIPELEEQPANKSMEVYTKLFAFKLRQYEHNIPALDDFLYYQCQLNFNCDVKKFESFFNRMLIQNQKMIDRSLEDGFKLWMIEYDRERYKRFDREYNEYLFYYETQYPIELIISDEQVRKYWSFLYLEKNDAGIPFLDKKDFDNLFKNGFKIPTESFPRQFKLELNFTSKYRKSIIEIAMYKFFSLYSKNQKSKIPFMKFLAYHFTNFDNYKTEQDFINWGKNFVATKMKEEHLLFDINTYITKAKSAI